MEIKLDTLKKFLKFVRASDETDFDLRLADSAVLNKDAHDFLALILKNPKLEDMNSLKGNLENQIIPNRWMKDRILATAAIYGVKIKDSESVDLGSPETLFKQIAFQFGNKVSLAIDSASESKDIISSKIPVVNLVVLMDLMKVLQSESISTESGVYVSFLNCVETSYDAYDTKALHFMKP
jgi:hypothetical protein